MGPSLSLTWDKGQLVLLAAWCGRPYHAAQSEQPAAAVLEEALCLGVQLIADECRRA